MDNFNDSKALAIEIAKILDKKKAHDVRVLKVESLTVLTDYFVIASATSEPHLRAVVNEITDKLRREMGLHPRAVDGKPPAAWLVLDYFDVIVHVMRTDLRERYDLEGLWGDAPRVRARKRLPSQPKPVRRSPRRADAAGTGA